jgi:Zinc-finger double-stranded RNA-binding
MDVEIDQTVDIIQKKREATDRQECVENDLKRITQEFYCESCDKRYKNVSEMSNHLSSYDHHHKKVLKLATHSPPCLLL